MARQISCLVLFLLLGFFSIMPAAAQSDSERLLAEGLVAYEQRDFRLAARLWEQAGVSQKHMYYMYYNIARAYEQLGEWGDARVNDMRAKAILDAFHRWTDDPDLDAALERGWARQEIQSLHPLIWIKRTFREITRPVGWGILGAGLWAGLWGALIVYFKRRVGQWILICLAGGMLLWGSVIVTNEILDHVLPQAVSFEVTPVYSGPGSDYALLTTWSEGYDLYIVSSQKDWVQVWRADGVSGWIERRFVWELQ